MTNDFTHQEIVDFIKTYLKGCGITEYDEYTCEYEDPIIQDITHKGMFTRIYGLPAPYKFGHIKIDIVDDYVSLRLTMNQEEKLDEEGQKLYKTDIMKTSQDIWVIDVPDNKKLSERWKHHRTGYNYGLQFNKENFPQFMKLFDIVFATEYKTNYIIQLASRHYEQERMWNEFVELAANAWNMNKNLWSCVNKFSTQWGEISQIWLINQYNLSYGGGTDSQED